MFQCLTKLTVSVHTKKVSPELSNSKKNIKALYNESKWYTVDAIDAITMYEQQMEMCSLPNQMECLINMHMHKLHQI